VFGQSEDESKAFGAAGIICTIFEDIVEDIQIRQVVWVFAGVEVVELREHLDDI